MKNLTYAISAVLTLMIMGVAIIIYGTVTLGMENNRLIQENNRLKRKINTKNQIIKVLENDIKACPFHQHLNLN